MTLSSLLPSITGGLIVYFACSGVVAAAWSLIVGRLKRTPPPPQPCECCEDPADWRWVDADGEPVNRISGLPLVPPTRSELAWLREQPGELLRGPDLRFRFDDVIDSARRAEERAQ